MSDSQEKDHPKDLSAIGETFKGSIAHMKSGFPAWEDFVSRGMKFQKHFEQTIVSFNGFVDGLYRISEVATNVKGGTHEIGKGLTNLAMWHRGQEMKLKEMNQTLLNKLLAPLQVKVEEWKKTTLALEREHDKELHKSVREIKESAKNTMKTSKTLETKLKKDRLSEKASALHQQLEQFQQETERRLKDTEDRERKNLNRVLLEERSWFCGFVNAITRVLDVEVGMLNDLERLQAILKDLSNEVSEPAILPNSTREMLEAWTIPSSPANTHKKMSSAPSMISVSSSSSGDSSGPVISGPTLISGPSITAATIPSGGGTNFPPPPPPLTAPPPSSGTTIQPQPPVAPVAPMAPVAPVAPMAPTAPATSVSVPPPPPVAPAVPPIGLPPKPPTAPSPAQPPPPPTSQPPPSSHQHFPMQYSQTLPRSMGGHRGHRVEGGAVPNSIGGSPPILQYSVAHQVGSGGGGNSIGGSPPVLQYSVAHQGGSGGGGSGILNGDHIQSRSLPPIPPADEEQFPHAQTSGRVVSNQSIEMSHSPSPTTPHPDVTLSGAPSEPEVTNSFQEQLMKKIRQRSNSIDASTAHGTSQGKQPDNIYSLPSFPTASPPQTHSNSVSGRSVPPPVSSKPSRAPSVSSKPIRTFSVSGHSTTAANGHGPALHSRATVQSFDNHCVALPRATPQELDLDPDDDNMFARALRNKALRKVQTNDRSNPLVGR